VPADPTQGKPTRKTPGRRNKRHTPFIWKKLVVEPGSHHSPTGANGVPHGQKPSSNIHPGGVKPEGFDVEECLSRERLHEFYAVGLPMVGTQAIKPIFQSRGGPRRRERVSTSLGRRKYLTD
jgi:hypothetical protein